jgi:hypothetical protein
VCRHSRNHVQRVADGDWLRQRHGRDSRRTRGGGASPGIDPKVGCAATFAALEVWDPDHATISANEFRIKDASRVCWKWFYYGRPQTDANCYFIEHVRTGDLVVATTNVDWAPSEFNPSPHDLRSNCSSR